MNFLKRREEQKSWYQIILWWEVRRIYYNLIIGLFGLPSFYICFVNSESLCLVLVLGLNLFYTLLYVIEILFVKRLSSDYVKINYPKFSFITYLILSLILVIGISVFIFLAVQSVI